MPLWQITGGDAADVIRRLLGVLGRRAFLTFGLVTFLVGALLATVHLTSRYALKLYVEDQLQRIPWDLAVYQQGAVGRERALQAYIAKMPGVTNVESLAFLRARFPESGEVEARVDGAPFNTPWLCLLAATDLSILPPQLGFALARASPAKGAVLALVGPEHAIGRSFVALQGARFFTLQVHVLDQPRFLFGTPIHQVIHLDRGELNRWLMDQTGSVSYIPAIGAILLMPFDWDVLTKFDFVASGLVPSEVVGLADPDAGHIQLAEYAPELVYLARIDRARLISGWDIEGSVARVAALTARLLSGAAERAPTPARDPGVEAPGHHGGTAADPRSPVASGFSRTGTDQEDEHESRFGGPTTFLVDSTTQVLLERMQAVARLIGLVSLLVSLPLLWMAWVLGAHLTGLLMLNERRTFGLMRLRGIPGELLGRALLVSISAGGAAGGLLGLAGGSIVTLLVYERGRLPLDVLTDARQLATFAGFLLVTVALALLVSRRLVRYATTISPLEASARVSGTEAIHASLSVGPPQQLALLAGSYVLLGWMVGFSISGTFPWFRPFDRLLDFLGLSLFLYGVASLLASNRDRIQRLMAPALRVIGGVLGRFALRHVAVKPHRTMAFLLIVALMASVSLYPVITSRSFEDKATRGARVQIGTDWQVLFNAPDLLGAMGASGATGATGAGVTAPNAPRARIAPNAPVAAQLAAMKPAVNRALDALRGVGGVRDATYLVEAILQGFYLPGYGLRGVPLYLFGDTAAYQAIVYSEPSVGLTDDFDAIVARARNGDVAVSAPVADFWRLSPGSPVALGIDGERRRVGATVAGLLAFLPGSPPKTISDRQGYVQARIDYLNYLSSSDAYLVTGADNPRVADLQVLIPRVIVLLRTTGAIDPVAFQAAITQAAPVPPLEIHSLAREVAKVGSDMYISLALANMRIYLLGGLALALVAILAVALANYTEDRRTLALLRIRGASPLAMWRFVLAMLLSPALVGLALGALAAVVAGFGLANYVWRLREIRTVVQHLPTRLVVAPLAGWIVLLLLLLLVSVASAFSWWVFRHTAHKSIQGL